MRRLFVRMLTLGLLLLTLSPLHENTLAATVTGPVTRAGAKQRAETWQKMKHNFGRRWEGVTRWYLPSAGDDSGVRPASEPLASIYQLEFPAAKPEVGTWRGWGVLEPGDERVVPLSEDTVIDRQPGSSTFQFDGVGGRNTLRSDGDVCGLEVNFFCGDRRCGVVLYYMRDDLGDLVPSRLMSMVFRGAPISHDGNVTFLDNAEYTLPVLRESGAATLLAAAEETLPKPPPAGAACAWREVLDLATFSRVALPTTANAGAWAALRA